MVALLIKMLVNGIGLVLITLFIPGIHMARWTSVVWAALVWGVVNSLSPSLVLFQMPDQVIVTAAFIVFINILLLFFTSKLVPGFSLRTLSGAATGAGLLSLMSLLLALAI